MIPHEPRPGTLFVGKFVVALARNGAGYLAGVNRRGPIYTPDPLEAKRWPTRAAFEAFLELDDSGGLAGRDFKLLVGSDELRIGPKPKPPESPPPKPAPKKKRKKAGANAELPLA
jgi:hypothetical protein